MSTSFSPNKSTQSVTKRLLHELHSYEEDPNPALLRLGPVNDGELLRWEAVMKGEKGSAYEGLSRISLLFRIHLELAYSCVYPVPKLSSQSIPKVRIVRSQQGSLLTKRSSADGQWLLQILIPANYSLTPPAITFVTPICHPNVHFKTGEICLDLLRDSWSPAYTISATLTSVHQLLTSAEADSPLNVDVAQLLRQGDGVGTEGLVRFCCEEMRWEWR